MYIRRSHAGMGSTEEIVLKHMHSEENAFMFFPHNYACNNYAFMFFALTNYHDNREVRSLGQMS